MRWLRTIAAVFVLSLPTTAHTDTWQQLNYDWDTSAAFRPWQLTSSAAGVPALPDGAAGGMAFTPAAGSTDSFIVFLQTTDATGPITFGDVYLRSASGSPSIPLSAADAVHPNQNTLLGTAVCRVVSTGWVKCPFPTITAPASGVVRWYVGGSLTWNATVGPIYLGRTQFGAAMAVVAPPVTPPVVPPPTPVAYPPEATTSVACDGYGNSNVTACLNTAFGIGKAIFVPHGKYTYSGMLTVRNGTRVYCAHDGGAMLNATDRTNMSVYLTGNAPLLEGCHIVTAFVNNRLSTPQSTCVSLSGSTNARVLNNKVENCAGAGIGRTAAMLPNRWRVADVGSQWVAQAPVVRAAGSRLPSWRPVAFHIRATP